MTSSERHNRLRIASWNFGRIAEAVDGESDQTEGTPEAVSTDTRTIEEGELFVALRGENFDGHEFVEQAAKKGACGAVVDREFETGELPDDFRLVRVDDTRTALGRLGHAVWREATREGLHTVAVTGSNGKTTTKEILRVAWQTAGSTYATPGNLNNEIGLPLTLCDIPVGTDHLIAEMGANAPGEISDLIRLAPGTERIVTSIGHAHTEGFGSIDGVRSAKSEIFEAADDETRAIVPRSERELLDLEQFPGRISTFGADSDADLRLVDYVADDAREGLFEATYESQGLGVFDRRFSVQLGLPGRHNGLNLAAALLTFAARGLPVDVDLLGERLAEIELPAGRWRRTRVGRLAFVDDAYNANPSSARASFEAFLSVPPPESVAESGSVSRIAVLGEMHELGESARTLHEEVVREIVAGGDVDAFCAVGSHASEMAAVADRVSDSTIATAALDEPAEIARWLRRREPAFVWMKASRAAGLERVIEWLTDDREDA